MTLEAVKSQGLGQTMKPGNGDEINVVVRSATNLLRRTTKWLQTVSHLESRAGSQFGRNVVNSLAELNRGAGVVVIDVHRKASAVVMSTAHYEELREMEIYCKTLLKRVQELEIQEAADKYEVLFQRITAPESHAGIDSLFTASADDLSNAYQPGQTENH